MSVSPRRLGQCVAAEAVHPAVLLPGALGVAVAVLICARAGTGPYPGWDNSITLGSVPMSLIAPLCFGVTALRRQSLTSSGFADVARTTPRGETGMCLVSTLAVGLWGLAALTAGNAAAALRATVSGLPDWRIMLLYLLGVAAIAAACAAGAALARFAATPITVAVASVGAVMAIMGLALLRSGLRFISPVDPGSTYMGWNQPNVELLARRVGLVAAVAVVAVSLWVAGRAWRRVQAVGAAAVALVLSLTFPSDMNAEAVIRSDTENMVCSTGRLPVCVWPEHRGMLTSATDAAARIATVAAGAIPLPPRLGEPGTLQRRLEGVGVLHLPTDPSQALSTSTGAPSPDMFLAVAAAVMPQAPPCAGDPVISDRRSTLFDWIMLRVGAGRLGATEDAQRIIRLPQEEQRTTIRALLAAADTCP
jgi:hypothetical protein